jgi:hypothetical protein
MVTSRSVAEHGGGKWRRSVKATATYRAATGERSPRRQLPRPGQQPTLGSGRLSSLRPIDLALAAEGFIPAAGVCMGMPPQLSHNDHPAPLGREGSSTFTGCHCFVPGDHKTV